MTGTVNGIGTHLSGERSLTSKEFNKWAEHFPYNPYIKPKDYKIATESVVIFFLPIIPLKTIVYYYTSKQGMESQYRIIYEPANGGVYWEHVKTSVSYYITPVVIAAIVLLVMFPGIIPQSPEINSATCGDGFCNNGESCSTCSYDCGTCSTPAQPPSFSSNENVEPYYSQYCDKINSYDLSVRQAAADAIRDAPGSYSVIQLFDIYHWVKQNIIYQNVPLAGVPYQPSETLATKSGDCKNQAVLIASMINSIGGDAIVVLNPDCEHAYAEVYIDSTGSDLSWFSEAVADYPSYGSNTEVNYVTRDDGIWAIIDPTGGDYPGDTLPECLGNTTAYYVTSCLDCANEYPDTPYTYGDYCYPQCPSGTVAGNQYSCHS